MSRSDANAHDRQGVDGDPIPATKDAAEVRARIAADQLARARAERRRALSLIPPSERLTPKELAEVAAAERKGEATPAMLRAIEVRAQDRVEDTLVFVGTKEQRDLETGADIEPEARSRGRLTPAYRVDGLAWLWQRKKITPSQLRAGNRWQAHYLRSNTESVKSMLDRPEVRVTADNPRGSIHPIDAKIYATEELEAAKKALGGHVGMIAALDAVCGRGERLTEGDRPRREYEKLESQLDCALSILAKHWGV